MNDQPKPTEHIQRKKLAPRTRAAIILLVLPTLLIVASFIIFSVSNLLFSNLSNSAPERCLESANASTNIACQEELFGSHAPVQAGVNILIFILGGIGVLSWLPGLIIGFILLVHRPKPNPGNTI